MIALHLDENNYIESYSRTHRTPGSVLVPSVPNEEDPEKLRCYKLVNAKDGEFAFDPAKWEKIQAERIKEEAERVAMALIEKIRAEIAEFKEELASTDYQIIKCFEYSLMKKELPYDLDSLHAKRQTMRDKINELEETLSKE